MIGVEFKKQVEQVKPGIPFYIISGNYFQKDQFKDKGIVSCLRRYGR
jgi:hypothetical protein